MVLSFVFSLAWLLTQSTIVLLSPLISNVSFSSSVGTSSTRGARSLSFFVGTLSLFSLFFFSVACLIDAKKLYVTSSLRSGPCANRSLRPPTCSIVFPVVEPKFVLPTCDVSRVRRHHPRTSVPPPRSGPPSQNRPLCLHDADVSIKVCPVRSHPKCVNNFSVNNRRPIFFHLMRSE